MKNKLLYVTSIFILSILTSCVVPEPSVVDNGQNSSGTGGGAGSCIADDGSVIDNGGSYEKKVYKEAKVDAPAVCDFAFQSLSCKDGVLSGNAKPVGHEFDSCSQRTVQTTTTTTTTFVNGCKDSSGKSVATQSFEKRDRFQYGKMVSPATCRKEVQSRQCLNGNWGGWSGGGGHQEASCSVVTASSASGTGAKQYVDFHIYKKFIGRVGEDDGINYWTGLNLPCNQYALQVFDAVESSDQTFFGSLSHTLFMDRLYRAFLGREADLSGRNSWVSKLNGGTTRRALLQSFLDASQEDEKLCQKFGISTSGSTSTTTTTPTVTNPVVNVPTNTTSAITITSQPESQKASTGRMAVFEVQATGSNLQYRWLKDGNILYDQITARLSFHVTNAYNGSQFQCIVYNSSGQKPSSVATLTVDDSGPYGFDPGTSGGGSSNTTSSNHSGSCAFRPITMNHGNIGNVTLPAFGHIVREAHYATKVYNTPTTYPLGINWELGPHMQNSCNMMKSTYGSFFPELQGSSSCEAVYNRVGANEWTPEEGCNFGQGSTAQRPTEIQEMWLGTMHWPNACADQPTPGTKYIVKNPNNGRSVVISMGFECGPGGHFIAGIGPEPDYYLQNNQDAIQLEIGLAADQSIPYGPINCN